MPTEVAGAFPADPTVILAAPFGIAALAFLLWGWRRWTPHVALGCSGIGVVLAFVVLFRDGPERSVAPVVTASTATLVTVALGGIGARLIADNRLATRGAGYLAVLTSTLAGACLVALSRDPLVAVGGLVAAAVVVSVSMWYRRTRSALSAVRRAVPVVAAGVALAVFGVVGGSGAGGTAVHGDAAAVAFVLGVLLLTGLSPLYGWWVSVHAHAPTPVAALASGPVNLCGVVIVVGAVTGPAVGAPARVAAAVVLVAAVVVALFGLWRAADLWRVWALSTTQVGALTGLAVIAEPTLSAPGVLLLAGHALVKTALILVTGQVDVVVGSTRVDIARGLWRRCRRSAVALTVGASLLGLAYAVAAYALFGEVSPGWWVATVVVAIASTTLVGVRLHAVVAGEPHADLSIGTAPRTVGLFPAACLGLAVGGVAVASAPWT